VKVPERPGLHGQGEGHLKISVSVTSHPVLIGFVEAEPCGPAGGEIGASDESGQVIALMRDFHTLEINDDGRKAHFSLRRRG
jgi:hypothetical protein